MHKTWWKRYYAHTESSNWIYVHNKYIEYGMSDVGYHR